MGSFAWDLSQSIFRLGFFAGELSFGSFSLGSLVWELSLPAARSGFELGGTRLLWLGEQAGRNCGELEPSSPLLGSKSWVF